MVSQNKKVVYRKLFCWLTISNFLYIIVLLILVAVSIATLTGENGVLMKANTAKQRTEIEDIIERARVDILGTQAEKKSGELKEKEVDSILEPKYGILSGEGEERILTTDKGYIIKVSDIWKGTTPSAGKTIDELYDGNNDWTDTENYNENAMHIGDYVNYTAGNWTETKVAPTSSTPFTFGGYTVGQSRDTNATGSYTYTRGETTYGEGKYEGWRIWDIAEDKQTITLISAGCPEVYYHPYGTNYAYNTEQILTGETTGTIDSTQPSTPRVWSDYINTVQYANSARVMKDDDFVVWYRKYIDSDITSVWDIGYFPLNTENKLFSTVENGFFYWLASAPVSNLVYCVCLDNYCAVNTGADSAYGVRVLVSLTSKVKFKEIPEKIEQDGFSYNKWIIE